MGLYQGVTSAAETDGKGREGERDRGHGVELPVRLWVFLGIDLRQMKMKIRERKERCGGRGRYCSSITSTSVPNPCHEFAYICP